MGSIGKNKRVDFMKLPYCKMQRNSSSILDVNSTDKTRADFGDEPDAEKVPCSSEDPDFTLPASGQSKHVKLGEEYWSGLFICRQVTRPSYLIGKQLNSLMQH